MITDHLIAAAGSARASTHRSTGSGANDGSVRGKFVQFEGSYQDRFGVTTR